MKVYRIRSNDLWYCTSYSYSKDEDDGVLFKNRSKCEKTVKNYKSSYARDTDTSDWIELRRSFWASAVIEEYELVRVVSVPA